MEEFTYLSNGRETVTGKNPVVKGNRRKRGGEGGGILGSGEKQIREMSKKKR